MKLRLLQFIFLLLIMISCGDKETPTGKALAKKQCSTCHLFPDPSLLDKKTWSDGVLPQMKFHMGLDNFMIKTVPIEDRSVVLKMLPGESMVTEAEWKLIQEYYLSNAPDSLERIEQKALPSAPFLVSELILPGVDLPLVTMVKNDTIRKALFVGTRANRLYKFDYKLKLRDSVALTSPPSAMFLDALPDTHYISLMGIMDPNDRRRGEISAIKINESFPPVSIIDSLKRPVHFECTDLDGDNVKEFIVAEFGNYTGALTLYSRQPDGSFLKRLLDHSPGARRVIVRDVNGDKKPDIIAQMTQGDERIVLFENEGQFEFSKVTLLRLPPVYGSSDFEIADVNNDGYFDLVVVNGDNADFSAILKPYHGIRIFINDGKQSFTENTFLPMYGAFRALPYDFDKDGDLDIAAVAFFPDFVHAADRGFIYFENQGGKFHPSVVPQSVNGRWLTMELVDINNDNKMDLILGALDFPGTAPTEHYQLWKTKRTGLLVLLNDH